MILILVFIASFRDKVLYIYIQAIWPRSVFLSGESQGWEPGGLLSMGSAQSRTQLTSASMLGKRAFWLSALKSSDILNLHWETVKKYNSYSLFLSSSGSYFVNSLFIFLVINEITFIFCDIQWRKWQQRYRGRM